MPNFIVSPYAISYNSIKNALEAYINDKSISEVLDTWKDFYTAGAGQTILELDAAIGAFYAFHFILGRREAYLPVAQNYNSVLGGAEGLGYNSSRGQNLHLSVKIVPNISRVLSKWDVIGSYAEYDIILWEDAILNVDEEVTLHCVVGNSAAQSIAITNYDIQQFTFTAEDTTDDVRLILTDTEVPVSNELKDAMDDNYIMLSNAYGSVDVFYLNNGQYNYKTGDTLYLQYIQRNTLKYSQISQSSLTIDYGSVTEIELLSDRRDKQSKESIKISAPIKHETNNVVRARKDYAKYLLSDKELDLLDTNDKDVNPGLIALTYLKEKDETGNNLLTGIQKELFIEKMKKVSPDGVAKAFIEDPIPVKRTLAITLWQNTGDVIPADVNTYIEEILDSYRNKLAPVLDLEAIEKSLEEVPGVKIARVDIGAKEYSINTKYKLYDIVEVKDVQYGEETQTWKMINSKVQTKSGLYTPDWGSAANINDTVKDNNLLWQRSNKYLNSISGRWRAGEEYNMYNDISVGYIIYANCTSYTYPSWNEVVVVDGNVTFNRIKTYDYALSYWSKNMLADVGQYVEFIAGNRYAIYKVSELKSYSGTEAPDWTEAEEVNDTVLDNAITWRLEYKGYNSSTEYASGDKIGFVKDGNIYVYRCINPCNEDTYYSNTKKKGSEQIPFDGSEEIKEWKEVNTNDSTTEQTGVDSQGNPIYTTNFVTEWQEGDTIWYLDDVIEDLSTWAGRTELGLFTYIQANNNIFYSIDISNCIAGEDWFSDLTEWPETYTDNNIVWELDEITTDKYAAGTTWYQDTKYTVGDIAIINGINTTYVYEVIYTNNVDVNSDNVVFSVSGYCGTTGTDEPIWSYENENGETIYYDTVIDNDILWTKTDNTSELTWEGNTTMTVGNIICVDESIYYTFSTVMGTSGTVKPNWSGIKNNVVVDNNIVWSKLGTTTKINLDWNEYLELDYTLTLN